MFNNKNTFITGGTGSFGKNFVKAILKNYKPERLIVFSRDELKQYEMAQEIDDPCVVYMLGDVRDADRLKTVLRGVDYVIHSAAMKQVPASEFNPTECIKTNIDGANNIISASIDNNVDKVIALSTDKAANPISLYGATKLVSDKLFIAANNIYGNHRTIFSVVRYGNVLDMESRGSIIPIFKRLLEKGVDKVPVTDPDMTRFWISMDAGIDIVFKGFERMCGGEIFIPKIPSMRLRELIEAIAPGKEMDVQGMRPGEKMHETLCPRDASHLVIEFDDHFVIRPDEGFLGQGIDYSKNKLGEEGRPVEKGFEYNSENNNDFLTAEDLKKLNI